jgi:hypothetical protein
MCPHFQDLDRASEFYEDKVKELGANIQDLEAIIQNKTNSLRIVEEGEFVIDGRIPIATLTHL